MGERDARHGKLQRGERDQKLRDGPSLRKTIGAKERRRHAAAFRHEFEDGPQRFFETGPRQYDDTLRISERMTTAKKKHYMAR
jgi:hypothetical protein